MKVLFIDPEDKLGGAQYSMVDIIKNMPTNKVIYSCAIKGEGELSVALTEAGANSIYFMPLEGWRWWETGFKNRLKLILSIPIQMINVLKWYFFLKKNKPDIIHFNLSRIIEPIFAAKLIGIPSIIHYREVAATNNSFFGGLPALFKILKLVKYWIANSNATNKHIIKYASTYTNICIINNGIDISKYKKKKTENCNNVFIVAKIAALVPWKNHKSYFEIIKLVLNKNRNIKFLVVGRGNFAYTNKLKKIAEKMGISDNLEFKGFVNDIPSLLRKINLLVHTSANESFGRVYVEAMAAGKPVLAIKGFVEDEVIGIEEGGFTFEKDQLEEMANKICNLINNPSLCVEIGLKGSKRAERLYSINALTNNIYNYYNKILL